jgi:spore coat polysaccharide biosynthesis protein SpsF (cytidylyltransferase family)
MSVGLFVQARLNSSRLPKKMLKTLYKNKPIIYLSLQAASELTYDEKVLLIPKGEKPYFKDIAQEFEFDIIEGPENDVLGRFIKGLNAFPNVDIVQRVCADKVIFSPLHQNFALEESKMCSYDLTHYIEDPVKSVTAGIYRAESLFRIDKSYKPYNKNWNMYREHIKPVFLDSSNGYHINTIPVSTAMIKSSIDISIDTIEDLWRMMAMFGDLYKGKPLDFFDVLEWFAENKKTI